jgi:hypothetical protein
MQSDSSGGSSAIDRAKAAWGANTSLIQGHKSELMERNNYLRTGITNRHFRAFRQFCLEEDQYVVAVRQTKKECVKWIEEGFPAKPGTITLVKCDPETGFVTCRDRTDEDGKTITYEEQRAEAWKAGYYVLEPKPHDGKRQGRSAATTDKAPLWATNGINALTLNFLDLELRVPRTDDGQYGSLLARYQRGTVVNSGGEPLTGDYDVMFAFPVGNPGGMRAALVGGTEASGVRGDSPHAHEPDKLLYERTNPWIEEIKRKLNVRLDGVQKPRIMHSFHDLRYDPTENNKGGCILFMPNETYWLPTPESVVIECEKLGRVQGWQHHTR